MAHGAGQVDQLGMADDLVQGTEAQGGEQLPDLLGDVLEEVDDEFGPAREALPQLGVLGGDAHRAGVEVADAHHDAPAHDQRGGGEAVFLGAEQGRDQHVPAGLELPVHLHDDAVSEPVAHQCLLGLRQAQLPRHAGVLEGVEWRGAGAAVVPGDQHHVGVGLRDAGGDGADADLGDQLDVDASGVVGVLEVVDELGQVLDGVDVMVRWRGDEPDSRGRVPGLGDPRVHLVAGQLAAFAGLGALGHLDLEVVGVDQILAGHAKST